MSTCSLICCSLGKFLGVSAETRRSLLRPCPSACASWRLGKKKGKNPSTLLVLHLRQKTPRVGKHFTRVNLTCVCPTVTWCLRIHCISKPRTENNVVQMKGRFLPPGQNNRQHRRRARRIGHTRLKIASAAKNRQAATHQGEVPGKRPQQEPVQTYPHWQRPVEMSAEVLVHTRTYLEPCALRQVPPSIIH